jgi:hypothetical protein
MDYGIGSSRWLEAHDALRTDGDPVLREAVTVIEWDSHFIPAKLRHLKNDPVQNDWNGSAKVALISIGRSEHALGVIHAVLADDGAAALRDALRALGAAVRREFPHATRFRRPRVRLLTRPARSHCYHRGAASVIRRRGVTARPFAARPTTCRIKLHTCG